MADQPHTTRFTAAQQGARVDGYAYLSWSWRFS
jgi:hypothetical protein